MMISFLQHITEDHDFVLQVLLPELIELLPVNIFTISKEEQHCSALQDVSGGNSYHGRILPDFQSVSKTNLSLKLIYKNIYTACFSRKKKECSFVHCRSKVKNLE